MKKWLPNSSALCTFAILCTLSLSIAQTPRNIVLLRVGDGSSALTSAATPIFVDEINSTTGTLMSVVALPTALPDAITLSGSSTAEGDLTTSTNGDFLALAGYNAVPGTASVSSTSSATVNRVVCLIDNSTHTVNTTTRFTSAFSGNSIRSAVTMDGTAFWVVGGSGGVFYTPVGANSPSGTLVSSNSPNNRRINIFNSQLFVSSGSSAFLGVNTVGSGVPTTSGQITSLLPGFTPGLSPNGFAIFDLNPNVAGVDVIYVGDDRSVINGGGLQRWDNDGSSWTLSTTFTSGIGSGVRSVVGELISGSPVLYCVTVSGTIAKLTDSGPSSAFTTLATAPTNTAFRGIAFSRTVHQQTITFDALADKSLGDGNFSLSATASSGLTVTFTSSNPNVATVSGNTVTIVGPGTSTITASQPGNASYSAAPDVQQTLTVNAVWHYDADQDGFGSVGTTITAPSPPLGYVLDGTDCDDTDVSVHPGAVEICGDLKDNNCDGTIDEGCSFWPTLPSSGITFSNTFSTQLKINFTPGDGTSHLVVLHETSAVNFAPLDGQDYTPDPNFSLAVDQGNGNKVVSASANTQLNITGLNPATTYFASIYEFNGSGNQTKYLTTGAATANIKTLALPNSYVSAPANNAINQNVTLTVSSIVLAGATTYTIELNTAPDFSDTPLVLNLRTQKVTGLAYGTTYYARVKTNLSPDYGKITSFTTAAPEQFAYVMAPANGATGVSANTMVTANTVIGANTYWIELSTNHDDFSGAIVRTGTRSQSFSGLLEYSTTYYTRVRTDLSLNYGEVRSFTTAPPVVYVTSPANNAVNQKWDLNLTANSITGATSYTVRLSDDQGFSTYIEKTGSTKTIAFNGLSYNTTYYSIVSTDVAPGLWGPVKQFTTATPSYFTYLTSPANGATNVNWVTNLTSYNVPDATTYTFELYTNPGSVGVDPPVMTKIGGRTQAVVLQKNTTYYVRVQTDLDPLNWGATKSFTTGDDISLAYVTSPKNLGVGVPTTVTVFANALTGATNYTIELNTASDFSGTSIVQTGSKRNLAFSGLSNATTYYARVQTNLAPGQWGTIHTSFSTVNPAGRGEEDWRGDESEEGVTLGPLQVKVFGNPFHEKLSFLIDTPGEEPAGVTLFDLTGKPVHESMEQTNTVIAIEKPLAQGIYILRVVTGEKTKALRIVKLD